MPDREKEIAFKRYQDAMLAPLLQGLNAFAVSARLATFKVAVDLDQHGSKYPDGMTLHGQQHTVFLRTPEPPGESPRSVQVIIGHEEDWAPLVLISSTVQDPENVSIEAVAETDLPVVSAKVLRAAKNLFPG
jgi:hypothetical protein